jgi:hypothetical protein
MTWTGTEGSHVFKATLVDSLIRTTSFVVDYDADAFKLALFGNTGTPDNDVSAANSRYGIDQWVVGNEKSDTNWPAGGRPLVTPVLNSATADVIFFDAVDTVSNGNVTLAAVFGGQTYDDTVTTPVADQGICYNYYGGSQSVTAGTFTVVHHVNGIWRATL